jgi:hypothetical protein
VDYKGVEDKMGLYPNIPYQPVLGLLDLFARSASLTLQNPRALILILELPLVSRTQLSLLHRWTMGGSPGAIERLTIVWAVRCPR